MTVSSSMNQFRSQFRNCHRPIQNIYNNFFVLPYVYCPFFHTNSPFHIMREKREREGSRGRGRRNISYIRRKEDARYTGCPKSLLGVSFSIFLFFYLIVSTIVFQIIDGKTKFLFIRTNFKASFIGIISH